MNPSDKSCWILCKSCYRCQDKGRYAKCWNCSGRHDPKERRDPYYVDDACRCKEGVLQFKLQTGEMVIRRFKSNPFEGKVITDAETEDERDWNSFVDEKRNQLGIENWDPVRFNDGTSTYDWMRKARGGLL
jgi:hypothetical protein